MTLVDPSETPEQQNARLLRIAEALMTRLEKGEEAGGRAHAAFERAALLEAQVKRRTTDLEHTLALLHDANAQLGRANAEAEAARANLVDAVESVDQGFALFDAEDRLVMSNNRFCECLADVQPIVRPGLTFTSKDPMARPRRIGSHSGCAGTRTMPRPSTSG